jgi:isopentenyl phosphate kinase
VPVLVSTFRFTRDQIAEEMSASPSQTPPVECIIKLGGAAITDKTQLETLNEEVLDSAAATIASLHIRGLSVVVVHGAGSFGHFQAAKVGLGSGGTPGIPRADLLHGFAETRRSVTRLNGIVVATLLRHGVPAVGISPLGSWVTKNREIVRDGTSNIIALLAVGLVPVIHGDAVLDEALGFTILGGDPILTRLCHVLRPQRAVFQTNCAGIFTRPPEMEGAALIRRVTVSEDGKWRGTTIHCELIDEEGLETSELDHDTTGGVRGKVAEAVAVAATGTPVRVVQAGTAAAAVACEVAELPGDWEGTEIEAVRSGGGDE